MAKTSRSQASARLEARVDPEIKALWQKAADLQGITLSDFVIASTQAAACTIIQQHQTLKLNQEDSHAFVNALLNPPPPNQALKKAAKRYRQLIQNDTNN